MNYKNRGYTFVRDFVGGNLPTSLQRFLENRIERKLKKSYYSSDVNQNRHNNDVIAMIDGRVKHGGLTDRINGIISIYKAAFLAKRDFKILFDYPFELTNYLLPNQYDWILTSPISYATSSKPLFIRSINNRGINCGKGNRMVKLIKKNPFKQLHIYSNILFCSEGEFSQFFHRLFKPTPALIELIQKEKNEISESYINATFRFQQLLGDFKEGDYKVLDPSERQNLISQNIEELYRLHEIHPTQKILVTSDSSSFINAVKEIDFIHTLSGKVTHMEYSSQNNFLTHAKAFIDLFLIAEASAIYSIKIGPMYESGFPRFASKIYLKPFYSIKKK